MCLPEVIAPEDPPRASRFIDFGDSRSSMLRLNLGEPPPRVVREDLPAAAVEAQAVGHRSIAADLRSAPQLIDRQDHGGYAASIPVMPRQSKAPL